MACKYCIKFTLLSITLLLTLIYVTNISSSKSISSSYKCFGGVSATPLSGAQGTQYVNCSVQTEITDTGSSNEIVQQQSNFPVVSNTIKYNLNNNNYLITCPFEPSTIQTLYYYLPGNEFAIGNLCLLPSNLKFTTWWNATFNTYWSSSTYAYTEFNRLAIYNLLAGGDLVYDYGNGNPAVIQVGPSPQYAGVINLGYAEEAQIGTNFNISNGYSTRSLVYQPIPTVPQYGIWEWYAAYANFGAVSNTLQTTTSTFNDISITVECSTTCPGCLAYVNGICVDPCSNTESWSCGVIYNYQSTVGIGGLHNVNGTVPIVNSSFESNINSYNYSYYQGIIFGPLRHVTIGQCADQLAGEGGGFLTQLENLFGAGKCVGQYSLLPGYAAVYILNPNPSTGITSGYHIAKVFTHLQGTSQDKGSTPGAVEEGSAPGNILFIFCSTSANFYTKGCNYVAMQATTIQNETNATYYPNITYNYGAPIIQTYLSNSKVNLNESYSIYGAADLFGQNPAGKLPIDPINLSSGVGAVIGNLNNNLTTIPISILSGNVSGFNFTSMAFLDPIGPGSPPPPFGGSSSDNIRGPPTIQPEVYKSNNIELYSLIIHNPISAYASPAGYILALNTTSSGLFGFGSTNYYLYYIKQVQSGMFNNSNNPFEVAVPPLSGETSANTLLQQFRQNFAQYINDSFIDQLSGYYILSTALVGSTHSSWFGLSNWIIDSIGNIKNFKPLVMTSDYAGDIALGGYQNGPNGGSAAVVFIKGGINSHTSAADITFQQSCNSVYQGVANTIGLSLEGNECPVTLLSLSPDGTYSYASNYFNSNITIINNELQTVSGIFNLNYSQSTTVSTLSGSTKETIYDLNISAYLANGGLYGVKIPVQSDCYLPDNSGYHHVLGYGSYEGILYVLDLWNFSGCGVQGSILMLRELTSNGSAELPINGFGVDDIVPGNAFIGSGVNFSLGYPPYGWPLSANISVTLSNGNTKYYTFCISQCEYTPANTNTNGFLPIGPAISANPFPQTAVPNSAGLQITGVNINIFGTLPKSLHTVAQVITGLPYGFAVESNGSALLLAHVDVAKTPYTELVQFDPLPYNYTIVQYSKPVNSNYICYLNTSVDEQSCSSGEGETDTNTKAPYYILSQLYGPITVETSASSYALSQSTPLRYLSLGAGLASICPAGSSSCAPAGGSSGSQSGSAEVVCESNGQVVSSAFAYCSNYKQLLPQCPSGDQLECTPYGQIECVNSQGQISAPTCSATYSSSSGTVIPVPSCIENPSNPTPGNYIPTCAVPLCQISSSGSANIICPSSSGSTAAVECSSTSSSGSSGLTPTCYTSSSQQVSTVSSLNSYENLSSQIDGQIYVFYNYSYNTKYRITVVQSSIVPDSTSESNAKCCKPSKPTCSVGELESGQCKPTLNPQGSSYENVVSYAAFPFLSNKVVDQVQADTVYIKNDLTNLFYNASLYDNQTIMPPAMIFNIYTGRILGEYFVNLTENSSYENPYTKLIIPFPLFAYSNATYTQVTYAQQVGSTEIPQYAHEVVNQHPPITTLQTDAGYYSIPPADIYSNPSLVTLTVNAIHSPGIASFALPTVYKIVTYLYQQTEQFNNPGGAYTLKPLYGFNRLDYNFFDYFNNTLYAPMSVDFANYTYLAVSVNSIIDSANTNQTDLYVSGQLYQCFGSGLTQCSGVGNAPVYVYIGQDINYYNSIVTPYSDPQDYAQYVTECAFGSLAGRCPVANPLETITYSGDLKSASVSYNQTGIEEAKYITYQPAFNSISNECSKPAGYLLQKKVYNCNVFGYYNLPIAEAQNGEMLYCDPQFQNGTGILTPQLGLADIVTTSSSSNTLGNFSAGPITICGNGETSVIVKYYGNNPPEPMPIVIAANPYANQTINQIVSNGGGSYSPSIITFPTSSNQHINIVTSGNLLVVLEYNYTLQPSETSIEAYYGGLSISYSQVSVIILLVLLAVALILNYYLNKSR
ncbi:MAG: hypothetical protein ARM1_0014 [Candidatus Micrarchaeota archaeon]|nr:MAG: hypothetical protein ARM1_0014 [Candidatus Micrarchaeota archaeon]